MRSELSWTEADFIANKQEVPDRLLGMGSEVCEADLMTDDEVQDYLNDSLKVLMILMEGNSDRLEQVMTYFRADLEFLYSAGRLDKEQYLDLLKFKDHRIHG